MIDVKIARVRVVSIASEESFMSNFDLAFSIVLGVGLAAAARLSGVFADACCERGVLHWASLVGG